LQEGTDNFIKNHFDMASETAVGFVFHSLPAIM